MDVEKQIESSTNVDPTTAESQIIEQAPTSPDQNVESLGKEGETTNEAGQNGGIPSEEEVRIY